MFLIFSLSITAFALDGEAPTYIDKASIAEYTKQSTVVYNPRNLDVFAPFGYDVLYKIFKCSLSTDVEYSSTEYFHIMYDTGDTYTSYFIVPLEYESFGIGDWLMNYAANTPKFYTSFLICPSNGPTVYSDYMTFNNFAYHYISFDLVDGIADAGDIATLANAGVDSEIDGVYQHSYFYSVERSKTTGLITQVAEISYGTDYFSTFQNLPHGANNKIVQISYSSIDKSYSPIQFVSPFTFEEKHKNSNLNALVSGSTYSALGYECFTAENASLISGSFKSNFSSISSNSAFRLPDAILKEEYQGQDMSFALNNITDSYPYLYKDLSIYNTEKSFFIIPKITSGSSISANSCYVFVFPDDITPILYFSWSFGRLSSYMYAGQFQVLSNVDYELYSCSKSSFSLIGTFDSETTTYTPLVKNNSSSHQILTQFCHASNSAQEVTVGTPFHGYPVFVHTATNGTSDTNIWFNYWFGNKIGVSMYPTTLNMVGFYTYLSADLNDVVILGGSIAGDDYINIPGIGGDGTVDPDDLWDIEPEWEQLWSTIFPGTLPETPDFSSIFDVVNQMSDILSLPELILLYFIEVIDWIAVSFEIYIDAIGGPLSKVFTFVGMLFDGIPWPFKFTFILSFFIALFLKFLSYASASSSLVFSSIGSSQNKSSTGFGSGKRRNKSDSKSSSTSKTESKEKYPLLES